MNDYHAFKSTTGGSGGGGGGGSIGCLGWTVIVIGLVLLISLMAGGAEWAAIDCLLGFVFIAFLIVRSL